MKSLRTDNAGVVNAWSNGHRAHSHKRTLTTDGESLYSYGFKIGMRAGGTCVVADYTAGTGSFKSQTTSCHVGLAKRWATLVMHPRVWLTSPLSDDPLKEVPF